MPAFKSDLEKLSVLRMKSGVFACLLTHLHVQRNKLLSKQKHKN